LPDGTRGFARWCRANGRGKADQDEDCAGPAPVIQRADCRSAGRARHTVAPAGEVNGAGEQGLAILQVDPQGKAAEAGVAAGDVIVKAGEQQLGNVGDLNDAMASASANGKSNVLVLMRRGDTQRYVAVPVA
jgi:S1-C subfamily serine protease